MKNFLYGLFVASMVAIVTVCLMLGANEQQTLNEAKEYRALREKITTAKVGSFVKLDGHGFLKTSRPTITAGRGTK